jgi:hypothetical protein
MAYVEELLMEIFKKAEMILTEQQEFTAHCGHPPNALLIGSKLLSELWNKCPRFTEALLDFGGTVHVKHGEITFQWRHE